MPLSMREDLQQHDGEATVRENKKPPENFEQAADMLIEEGNALMAKNHGPEGDQKVYHTLEAHIQPLQERARTIADILGLTLEQRKLIAIAISYHDTIIEYDAPDPEDITGMIRRHRGAREGDNPPIGAEGNEALSAKVMQEAMERINREANKDIFSEEQIRIVRQAIDATYPDVDFGPDFKGAEFAEMPGAVKETMAYLKDRGIIKGPHFFQPHLENPLKAGESVPEEVLVMALVDLGAAGLLKDSEEFFTEGDNEGREVYHNLRKPENIGRLLNGDMEKDKEDRINASQAILGWMHSQPGFAMWQMIRFEKIMSWVEKNGQVDAEKREKLRLLFGNYEANIKAAADRDVRIKREYDRIQNEQGEKQAFVYLAQEMSYME